MSSREHVRELLAGEAPDWVVTQLAQEIDNLQEELRAAKASLEGAHQVHLARERTMGEMDDLIQRLRDASAKTAAANVRLQEEFNEKDRVLKTWVVAFGLLTNLKPDLELDPTHPQEMAEEIHRHVALERAMHRQLNQPPPGMLSIKIACGEARSEHLIPAVMVLSAMDPPRMVAEALSDEVEKVLDEALKQPAELGLTKRKPQ